VNWYRITCAECGGVWSGWLDGLYRVKHRHMSNGVRMVSEGWWLED
jgi:hypothetical protein